MNVVKCFFMGSMTYPCYPLFVVKHKNRLEETDAVLRKTETCKLQLLYLPLGIQNGMVFLQIRT